MELIFLKTLFCVPNYCLYKRGKDYWDYPKDVIREALLNSMIHRDCGFSGSIIINVNDRCMEFISIGGLLPGISKEDICNGISQLRNKKLAEVFHRLNFIEAYGTGTRRIFSFYKNCPVLPVIDVTPNSFKITLPNMNTAKEKTPSSNDTVTPQMQTLLAYLKMHGEMSDSKVQELLNIKRTRAFTLVKQMADIGLIKISGRGQNKKYIALSMRSAIALTFYKIDRILLDKRQNIG